MSQSCVMFLMKQKRSENAISRLFLNVSVFFWAFLVLSKLCYLTRTTLSNQKIQHPIQHLHLNGIVCDIIQRVRFGRDKEKVGNSAVIPLFLSLLREYSVAFGSEEWSTAQFFNHCLFFRLAYAFPPYDGLFTSIVNIVDRKYSSTGKNSKYILCRNR